MTRRGRVCIRVAAYSLFVGGVVALVTLTLSEIRRINVQIADEKTAMAESTLRVQAISKAYARLRSAHARWEQGAGARAAIAALDEKIAALGTYIDARMAEARAQQTDRTADEQFDDLFDIYALTVALDRKFADRKALLDQSD